MKRDEDRANLLKTIPCYVRSPFTTLTETVQAVLTGRSQEADRGLPDNIVPNQKSRDA
jgi:hypothetical protein